MFEIFRAFTVFFSLYMFYRIPCCLCSRTQQTTAQQQKTDKDGLIVSNSGNASSARVQQGSLTLCLLGNFVCVLSSADFFFKNNVFEKVPNCQ